MMREAAALEALTPKHAVTAAPTIPANEWAGDLYMLLNRPALALAEYERALELYPGRFNSLAGAARAARGVRNTELARRYYQALIAVSDPSSSRPAVLEAREALGVRRPT